MTIFACLVRLVFDAQQERRVDGDEGGGTVGEMQGAPPHLGDGDDPSEQAARRGGAEGDDGGGLYNCALGVEPDLAALDLIGVRALVQAPLAAHLVLEVFNRIGDEGIVTRNAGL